MTKEDTPIPEECEFSVISLGCVWNHTFAVSCLVPHLLSPRMMEKVSWLGSMKCMPRFTSVIKLHWVHMGWGMGANVGQSLVINPASISPWSRHYGLDTMVWTQCTRHYGLNNIVWTLAKVDTFRMLFFPSLSLILFYSSDLVTLQETKYGHKLTVEHGAELLPGSCRTFACVLANGQPQKK